MKKKLGEFLTEQGLITPEELTKVLALQQALRKAGQSEEKTYLGQLLVKRNLLTPQQLTQLLSEQASQEEPADFFIETPSQASEKETAQDDLFGAIESFSAKAKPSIKQVTNTSTLLPNFSQPKKEDQSSRTQKLWKEFEVEEKKRYAVLKTLGEGGMGIVELVRDQLLGREVARKTIKTNRKSPSQSSRKEEVLLWRFKKEADITALLEHPHIIPLYEMQRPEQGEIQFTMRKVEGQTLRSLLQKKRKGELDLDETQILSIFRKVCDAIAYAHSKGVIHRDLKPDNVMVGQFGEVYVMDWGISKRLEESPEEEKDLEVLLTQQEVEKDDLYKTIGGMGTPGYMSPEQQENASNVTPQSDIYSLGKILRECFTLLSPMEELKQQAKKSLQAKNATKKKTTEGIPEEIEAIEKKATQENPTDRYESVQEFIQDLEKYQDNLKVSAKEYGLLETLAKWAKRNKQKITVVLLIVILSIGLFSYFQWLRYQEMQKTHQEKQNKVHVLLQKAKESQILSINLSEDTKQVLSQKVQYSLTALNYLNEALSLIPYEASIEEEKLKIGKELIRLSCKTQDYNLANYTAKDLKGISSLKPKEQENLLLEIQEAMLKVLNEHLKCLEEWIKKFKMGTVEEGERENAIFEISKMTEEEIFKRLIQILKEGTQYFLSQKEPQSTQEEFYKTFVEILGRQENPKAGILLLQALKIMEEKIFLNPVEERKIENIQYMVSLVQALGYSKTPNMALALEDIRRKIGYAKNFYYRTQLAYKTLAKIDGLHQIQAQTFSDYYIRGYAKQSDQDWDGAIEDYTAAILLNSKFDIAYYQRGFAKWKKNDLPGAEKDLSVAIQLDPKDPTSYNQRGIVRFSQEKVQEAIDDFNQAIQLNPQNTQAYLNRGNVRQFLGQLEEAVQDYNRTIQLDPQNALAYNNRGITKTYQQHFEEASQDLTWAIQFNPKLADAYLNRGNIYQAQGNLDAALQDYTKAVNLNFQLDLIYINRGFVKYQKNDILGAKADFQRYLELTKGKNDAQTQEGRKAIFEIFSDLK